jgi:sugar (pentulose or hexulose) kinase
MTVAGHDHQAAAVGAGAIGPGDELDSCGSAEALIRTIVPGLHPDAVARLAAAGITCGWHAVPDRWCLLGGTQGGLELQRVLDELNISADQLAEFEAPAPSDAARRWLATVEAVTEDARAVHLAMSEVAGECGSLVATGGWARSKYLLQAKTRLLGELTVSPVAEAGARGAALLAGVAAEVYGSLDELPTLARDDREVVPA